MSAVVRAGYKASQIGPIPTDWTVASFGSLLSESPQYGANATAESAAGADRVRYIRITDIHENGSLIDSGKKYLNNDAADGYLLADQDIVIARTGNTVGKSLLYRASMGEAAFAGYLIRFRTGDALDCRYVSQFLRSDAYWAWVRRSVKVGAQPNINSQQYQSLLLPLPTVAEQQKIAAILEAVDDKLDVIARQIEATQTLKQGLMQTLFSRGVGAQDGNGRWEPHAEFKDSPFGLIPSKWGIKTLGGVCDGALQTGPFGSQLHAHEYQDEGVPVLMPKDLVNCRANLETAAKVSPTRAEELDKHRLNRGNLLFSRRGDVARFALIDEKSEGALCGTGCLKAIPGKAHSPAYLAHLLQLDVVRTWLEQNAVGQTMPNMNTAILASLPLVVPDDRAEQERIADILDGVDAKSDLLSEKRTSYEALKHGLMQKLLTGEWRVKVDAETLA